MPRQKHKNAWEAVQSKSTLLKIVCNKHHTVCIKKFSKFYKQKLHHDKLFVVHIDFSSKVNVV